MTITTDEINFAYTAAADAVRAYASAAARSIEVKEDLKVAEMRVITGDVLEGLKNDTARNARLRDLCAVEYALLAGAEADETRARGEAEARKLEVGRIEMLMRLAELGKS